MVVRWRYAYLSMEQSRNILCNERVVHVHYVAIDDLVITTPLKKKKKKKNNRYSRPLVMLW